MLDVRGMDEVEIDYNVGNVGTIDAPADTGGVAHFRADLEVSSIGAAADAYPDGIKYDAPLMVTADEPVGSGFVLFTSFHNSPQASQEVIDISEHMIFQL